MSDEGENKAIKGKKKEIVLILIRSYKSHLIIGVVIGQLQDFISFLFFTYVSHSEVVLILTTTYKEKLKQ